MLEKQIEAQVCEYARSQGMLAYKFTSPARAAVPDRLFVCPNGSVFFIEFKRTGEKLTGAQLREAKRLRDHNAYVFMVDCVEAGMIAIDKMRAQC